MFAPAWEKALWRALVRDHDPAALPAVVVDHPEAQQVAAVCEAVLLAIPQHSDARARELLAWAFSVGYDPAADPFVRRYLPDVAMDLEIADGIEVRLPLDRDTIGLALAELHQRAGDLAAAVHVVEQLAPTTVTAVSLAELYAAQARWEEVVTLTDGLTNDDDPSTYLLIQRGAALRELGFRTASREALREALRVRSRPTALRHRALVERGQTYVAEGKLALARKDFERVLAEDSSYPGLAEHLGSLGGRARPQQAGGQPS